MRLYWFLLALFSCAILALVHNVATAESLYWTYRWLDVPMHLLGGFGMASLLIAFLFRYRPVYLLLGMVAISVGWEVFEVLIGTPQSADYVFDTAKDLLNNAIGGSVAYVLARYTIWHSA